MKAFLLALTTLSFALIAADYDRPGKYSDKETTVKGNFVAVLTEDTKAGTSEVQIIDATKALKGLKELDLSVFDEVAKKIQDAKTDAQKGALINTIVEKAETPIADKPDGTGAYYSYTSPRIDTGLSFDNYYGGRCYNYPITYYFYPRNYTVYYNWVNPVYTYVRRTVYYFSSYSYWSYRGGYQFGF